MHHTRKSGRSSPLIFDPEIEKSARQNRVFQRENKATNSPFSAKMMDPSKQPIDPNTPQTHSSEPFSSQPTPPVSQQQPPTPTFPKLSDPPITQTHQSSPFTYGSQSMPSTTRPIYASSNYQVPPPVTTTFEQGGFSGNPENVEYDDDFEHAGYEDDPYAGPYASYDDGYQQPPFKLSRNQFLIAECH